MKVASLALLLVCAVALSPLIWRACGSDLPSEAASLRTGGVAEGGVAGFYGSSSSSDGRGRGQVQPRDEESGADTQVLSISDRAGSNFHAEGSASQIEGEVVDPSGIGVEGATVWIDSIRIYSDKGGGFQATIDPESARRRTELFASKEGFSNSEVVSISVPTNERVILRLGLAASIQGRVLLDTSVLRRNGAHVMLEGESGVWNSSVTLEGLFSFNLVPSGEYRIRAIVGLSDEERAMHFAGQALEVVVSLQPGEVREVLLDFGGEGPYEQVVVHGRIIQLGSLYKEVTIVAEGLWGGEGARTGFTMAGEDGGFRLELAPGAYRFWLDSADVRERCVGVVKVPKVSEFYLSIPLRAGRIAGRVEPFDGSPIAILLQRADVAKDVMSEPLSVWSVTGDWAFGALDDGVYSIWASRGAGQANVVLRGSSSVEGIVLDGSLGGVLAGSVSNSSGAPSVASVAVVAADGRLIRLVQSSVEEGFRVRGLAGGLYRLAAYGDGLTSCGVQAVVVPGSEVRLDLHMSEGANLIASVSSEGEPVFAYWRITPQESCGIVPHAALARYENMELTVGPLMPGQWHVQAVLLDGREVGAAVDLAEEDAHLLLKAP